MNEFYLAFSAISDTQDKSPSHCYPDWQGIVRFNTFIKHAFCVLLVFLGVQHDISCLPRRLWLSFPTITILFLSNTVNMLSDIL